jgi:FAD/FMN-containing dehydrogenase/Fe-S oxidoreductase
MIPRLNIQDGITPVYHTFLEALIGAGFTGDVESSYSSRLAVATDNSVYQWLPQAVLFPRSTADVVLLTTLAQAPKFSGISFSARGGGTGTNGQSLNDGLIVDLSRHMHGILEFNLEQRWVRVQAGLVKDKLNEFLKPHGLFFSPELSTSNRATIGGMINTDASGQGSLVYGKTSAHVLAVTAVLDDGCLLQAQPVQGEALAAKLADTGREGVIYQQVLASARDKRDEIEATFPKLNRFLTGYDLKHVYDPTTDAVDLSRLLCGSEGTLAFITEAKLDLTPIPAFRTLVNVKYDSFESALRNAPVMVAAEALSVETVDSRVLDLARGDIIWHSVKHLIEDVPGKNMLGINIIEFAGDDASEQARKVQALSARLDALLAAGASGVIGYQICDELASIETIYAMRKKAVGLLGNAKGRKKPVPFTEDTAVPPEKLADFIMEFRALLDANQLSYGMFGHVDCGVLHVRPALDLCDPEQEVVLRQISDQVVALTAKYGGLMWGEHGRGFRSEYGPAYFGALFDDLRKIKAAFDPLNRMNPGKICTPMGVDTPLVSVDATKRGAFDRQIPVTVRDSFTDALSCNGNGLCFTFEHNSPMCPSFKLTGDRRHSPKGRATLMREWLRQLEVQGYDPLAEEVEIHHGGIRWRELVGRVRNTLSKARGEYDFSHEVMDAMQGCLACKACASQCPIKVDVPAFRSRFMEIYHQRYLRPAKDYFVATVESYAPLMAKAPGVVNYFLKQNWVQRATEKAIGMVDVPILSEPTLKQELAGHGADLFQLEKLEQLSPEARQKVVLVVQDPFTSYYDAPVVRDLILLIEKLGFRPLLLPFKPNGKPQHIKGFLRSFARTAANAAQFFNRLHHLGIPMVGPDPAMVLCYRDEYVKALGDARGEFNVQLPQEWLLSVLPQLARQERAEKPQFYLFAHCTEKTVKPSTHGDWGTLFGHFGAELKPVAVGCCGMAGTYGHDVKHLQDSKEIYQMSWGPAMANLPKSQCLATGYSCRSQVKRMEGEKLQHPLQALLSLL